MGAVSLMPEDNVNGFRPDVIRLLRDLNSGIYRWGGNMSSAYDWRDGVGDPDLRPPRYEYAWDALENNDVGTDEMLNFAKLINVELCISVNAGLGDAYSAAQWVEYVNGAEDSAMGKTKGIQWSSRSLRCKTVVRGKRNVWLVAIGAHRFEKLHHQAQPVCRKNESG